METGKANSTVDALSEVGAAVGLKLVFVPYDTFYEVLATIGAEPEHPRNTRVIPRVFGEVFILDNAEPTLVTPPNAKIICAAKLISRAWSGIAGAGG